MPLNSTRLPKKWKRRIRGDNIEVDEDADDVVNAAAVEKKVFGCGRPDELR